MTTSFETWEFYHFPQLLHVREIFLRKFPKKEEQFLSVEFFEGMAKKLYEISSKKIDGYQNPLSLEEEEMYSEYLIKRSAVKL